MLSRKDDGATKAHGELLRVGTLSPFRHRLFLAIWSAALVSHFGGQIQGVGASWLMTELAGSAQLIALVATATLLPVLLFSLPFGAMADICDRRKVLLVAQTVMFSASMALALLAFADAITPNLLLVLTFVLGCGFALNSPAWQAAVREFVPADELEGAISLNILGFHVARTVAPALGGIIVAAAGPKAAFAVNACTYIALFVVLLRWRRTPDENSIPPEGVMSAMANGIRYLLHAESVGRIACRATLFGLCLASMLALIPLVARDLLGGGPLTFGMLLAFGGIGSVIGASSATRLRTRFAPETITRGGQLLVALAIAIIAASRSIPLTCFAELLSGAGMVLTFNSFTVTMQLSVPRWVVGRAMSIYQMGTFGGLALGSLMWGTIADATGVSVALGLSSAVLLAAVLTGIPFPLRQPDPQALAPGKTFTGRQLDLAEDDADATVAVTVEYRISDEDLDRFLGLMRQRRQIIRRDGATSWSLAQEADDQALWCERFVRPNWTDFLRHRQRRTKEEEDNLEAILALHRGDEEPRLRYFLEREPSATKLPNEPQLGVSDPRWG